MDFHGRTAFITGGARGIGLGLARACAKAGAQVAVVDIDEAALETAKQELSSLTEVRAHTLDVRDREAFAHVADQVEEELGPVTLLFNNAGVADSVSPTRMDYASWDWVMGINVNGVYNGVQTFVPRMIAREGRCHVVNTSSGAGLVAFGSGFLYHASKYAVVGLTESLHLELAHHDIGVSLLCPGPVATDIVTNTQSLRPEGAPEHSTTVSAKLERAHANLQSRGLPVDVVAEMVLDAIRENRLYIHTDDMVGMAIAARTEALLAAMPSRLLSTPATA